MDCWNPILLRERGKVPCGKCLPCLQRKQQHWVFRLEQEYKVSSSCYFVTLTYSEDNVPKHNGTNVLCKRDFQLYMKRLRTTISPNKIRFFACGEYGTKTLRPHYHAIIFNIDEDNVSYLDSCWNLGFTVLKRVHTNHFYYVAKYCNTTSDLPDLLRNKQFRPFLLCSRNPAIGSSYLTDSMVRYHRTTLSTVARMLNGYGVSLPRYYRGKIFDDDMICEIRDRANDWRAQSVLLAKTTEEALADLRYTQQQIDDYTRRYQKQLNKSSKI